MHDAPVNDAPAAAAARPITPTTVLASELSDLCRRLDEVSGIDPALRDRLRWAHALAAGLDPYLSQCTTAESPALAELARRTRAIDWAAHSSRAATGGLEQEMLSGHVAGQTLKVLVHLARARRVLEVGMFTGYSALAMAEALPADGTLVACEVDADVAEMARAGFDASPIGHKITVKVAPAIDTLRSLSNEPHDSASGPFDFVFIDADKPGYLQYVDFLLNSTLLAPGAVIAVDNTLLQGEPYLGADDISINGRAIAAFNTAIAADPRVEQVVLPLRDGMTLIRRAAGPS